MTSKSPVGDISVVTLIRTDTTLDHSQKAEKVDWKDHVCARHGEADLAETRSTHVQRAPSGFSSAGSTSSISSAEVASAPVALAQSTRALHPPQVKQVLVVNRSCSQLPPSLACPDLPLLPLFHQLQSLPTLCAQRPAGAGAPAVAHAQEHFAA